jgi:predicted esterase
MNGNVISNDYSQVITETEKQTVSCKSFADTYGYVALTPVIPRTNNSYTVALERETFYTATNSFDRRADEKVNLMIDELASTLKTAGYNMQSKVFLIGFSAGAMFAQRYAILHPDRVQAIAVGQIGGFLVLPETSYNGTSLDWSMGVNDLTSLSGLTFDQNAYKKVPQYIYIGDLDTANSHFPFTAVTSESQRTLINNTFGSTDPVRVQAQSNYLISKGHTVTFTMYQGVGHTLTSQMVSDSFDFFKKYK